MSALLTLRQLQSMCTTQHGVEQSRLFYPYLTKYFGDYEINSAVRIAAFLAQVLHECSEFRYLRELGSDAYLDKYDTGKLAKQLGNTPIDDDDGQKYRGRGLIQVTGRDNYARAGHALGMDLIADPELLELPEFAVRSACWYWVSRDLNKLADVYDFRGITKAINGGYNGIESRVRYWGRARRALGLG